MRLSVVVRLGERAVVGVSSDLSASGIRVEAEGSLVLNEDAVVAIELPGQEKGKLSLTGYVVRVDAESASIKFYESIATVRAYVRNALVARYSDSIHIARLVANEERYRPHVSPRLESDLLSIVVPMYNEAENVEKFHEALSAQVSSLKLLAEIIFVDDGSTDGTLEALQRVEANDPSTKIISLSRNFGHQAALFAGLEASTGIAVITMDGDLQHPPQLIGDFIDRWKEGYDVVNALRRDDDVALKSLLSVSFYRVFSWLARMPLPAGSADFRLLDRFVVDRILALNERQIFIRGLVHWVGYRSTSIEYRPNPRMAGDSKFNFRRMLSLALDGIFAFSFFPLRVALFLGVASLGMSFLMMIYVVVGLFLKVNVPGWSSLLVVSSFFGGLQLLVLGTVAEYVGRIFNEVKMRPRYLTKLTTGREDPIFRALALLATDSASGRPAAPIDAKL